MSKDSSFWHNRQTFSVWLAIEGDKPTKRVVYHSLYNFGTESLRELCYRLWPDGRTPDNQKLSKANWKQLGKVYDKIIFGIENKYELFP